MTVDNINLAARSYGRSIMKMARGHDKNKALFYIDNEDAWEHVSEGFSIKGMEQFLEDNGIEHKHSLEDAVEVVKDYLSHCGFDV